MIAITYLQDVRYSKKRNMLDLHKARITDCDFAEDFPTAVSLILSETTYPKPQTHKGETYGFSPTSFKESVNEWGERGFWRSGENADEHLTLFIADLDNQHSDRTMVPIDSVQEVLDDLGLSYLLYTSFSHTPERHKVRIITPISRVITSAEAFQIFVWFNTALDRQLDGSIYDPGDFIYGPPHDGDVRTRLDGAALDVDAYLAMSAALSPEDREAVATVTRVKVREPTPEEIAAARAQWENQTPTDGASINNPAFFNVEWLEMLRSRYVGGSRRQTSFGLLCKAWIKSKRTLTRSDLADMQREMDWEYSGYLTRQYGRHALEDDLRNVMEFVGSEPMQSSDEQYQDRLSKNLNRINRLTRKENI